MDQSSAIKADSALRKWYASKGSPSAETFDWSDYDAMVSAVRCSIPDWPARFRFTYTHPEQLQDKDFGLGKPYEIPLNATDPGGDGPPIIAIGGLINVAQRFDFMSLDLMPRFRLISLDLAGRGRSGWMAEQSDYTLDAYVEQLRQLMDFLKFDCCTLLGSSLGGSIALRFAADNPDRVRRIILNDSGPFIPLERRARRASAVGRHYVFRSPAELLRRTGAATRPVGYAPDAVLLHNFHHKTRWSDDEIGRIYRHDLRATLAYRNVAVQDLNMWDEWSRLTCPVLLLHGTESDATSSHTIDRMRSHPHLSVIHVHGAGHTPSLGDYGLTQLIAEWLKIDRPYSKDVEFRTAYNPIRLFYPDARRRT